MYGAYNFSEGGTSGRKYHRCEELLSAHSASAHDTSRFDRLNTHTHPAPRSNLLLDSFASLLVWTLLTRNTELGCPPPLPFSTVTYTEGLSLYCESSSYLEHFFLFMIIYMPQYFSPFLKQMWGLMFWT